jgi:hypothetical protein
VKLSELVTEAVVKPWDVQPVSKSLETMLNGPYSNFWKSVEVGGLLFRGFNEDITGNENFVTIDTTKAVRTSRDLSNLYQLMMDQSTAFRGYPSRSSSLICSTSRKTANRYAIGMKGNVVVVVPPNSASIAVSNHQDFIFTSFFEMNSITSFDRAMKMRLTSLGVKPDVSSDQSASWTDASSINKHFSDGTAEEQLYMLIPFTQMNLIDPSRDYRPIYLSAGKFEPISPEHQKFLAENGANTKFGNLILNAFRKSKARRFDEMSSAVITPETLGIKLAKPGDALKHDVECWTSGKCLIISLDEIKTLLQTFRKAGGKVAGTYHELML